MTRELTDFERKVFHKLLSQPDLDTPENAVSVDVIQHWFLEDEQERAQKAVEYFAHEPNYPIEQTQDGRIYISPTEDISKWIDKAFSWPDIEEASEEEIREMIKEVKEMNVELLDELRNERKRSKEFRQSGKRWRIASILISFGSFLLGFLTGFGFL